MTAPLTAQVSPAGRWLTLTTPHFRVHFRPGADSIAYRAAGEGERAYRLLSSELVPPRTAVDLVLSDAADFANGAASVFPTNRIVLLLTPSPSDPDLQNFDDWIRVVLTHELTHIFHLDRVRGPWRVAQSVFGRAPGTFPNLYQPAWVTEGLATYYESRFTGGGRPRGTFHSQILLGAAHGGHWPHPNEATYLSERWPDGISPYAFGSRFLGQVREVGGDSAIPRFVEAMSGQWIPFRTGHPLATSTGIGRDSVWEGLHQEYDSLAESRKFSVAETIASSMRALPSLAISRNGALAWFSSLPDQAPFIVVRDTNGKTEKYLATGGVDLAWNADTLYADWLELTDPLTYRSDLHRLVHGHWTKLTSGQRLTDVAAGANGILAVQIGGQGNRLVQVSGDSTLSLGRESPDVTWASPAVSRNGSLVAVQHDPAGYHLVFLDPEMPGEARVVSVVAPVTLADPAWDEDSQGTRALLFVSDTRGLPQIYRQELDGDPLQLTDEPMGALQPQLSPDGWLYFATLEAQGYALKRMRMPEGRVQHPSSVPRADTSPPFQADTTVALEAHASGYRPWPALQPHYFIPLAIDKGSAGLFLGAFTSGTDPVGRLAYSLALSAGLDKGSVDGSFAMVFRRWNHHAIDLYLSQDHGDAGTISAPVSAMVLSRERDATVGFNTTWRHWYPSSTLRLALDYEQDSFTSRPALRFVNPEFVGASAGFSVARVLRPPLAISDEDGAAFSIRYRRRWRMDEDGWSDEWRGRAAGYIALKGVGGYAHPVLAMRLTAATSSGPDRETFGVGGASGITYQPLPGIVAGSSRQFPVRGYEAGETRGGAAAVATAELRIPVALVARGLGDLPYGLDRVSLRLFFDYGRAWAAPRPGLPRHLQSSGVEVTWDLVVLYDVPLRLRTGIAVPLEDGSVTRRGDVRFGLGFGSEF
ncbi:MAG: hypothetical protein ABI613_07690 [Gemmatimonadota bacterium]